MHIFSKTHQVLCINELLGLIADDLSLKDQLQMSLTCRAIYEPIMDRNWQQIPSVARLIRCLPKDVIHHTTGEQGFFQVCLVDLIGPIDLNLFMAQANIVKTLEPHHWERLQHYARRVKAVNQSKNDVHPNVWLMLWRDYPGKHMFPRLRRVYTTCQNALAYLGKAPMIEVLSFNMWPVTSEPQLEFPVLSSKGPSLDDFLSFTLTARLSPGLHLDDIVRSCCHLTELDVPSFLNPETLVHLSRLPSLTHLGFYLGNENYDSLASATDATVFRRLKSLRIHARDSSQLIRWLSSVTLLSLTTLRIFTSKESTKKLFNAIAKFKNLGSLHIIFSKSTPCLPKTGTEYALRPLLSLSSIEELSLLRLSFCVSQTSATDMAKAWPKLRRLQLTRDPKVIPLEPRITYDFSVFQEHCPGIQSVLLHFSSDRQVPVHTFEPR